LLEITMKRALFYLAMLSLTLNALGGFKVKLVKPKKPEKYQVHQTLDGITYAADLLVRGKDHKKFFYRELDRSNIIVLRLAIFNRGKQDVVLPIASVQLIAPGGTELETVAPNSVAQAALGGLVVVPTGVEKNPPVAVTPTMRRSDPRTDRTDPRYDPRYDPTSPQYDPNDPRVRQDGRYRGYYPSIDVVLSPGGGGVGDVTQFERALVEKDFEDKAHPFTPVPRNANRDKFIYFSMTDPPEKPTGFTLRLSAGEGTQPVVLQFK
jgi:hypothetical protein